MVFARRPFLQVCCVNAIHSESQGRLCMVLLQQLCTLAGMILLPIIVGEVVSSQV